MLKSLTTLILYCCVLIPTNLLAQTPGIIVRPAGAAGPLVLDANGDGYTSATIASFATNDITGSEIKYKVVLPLYPEPTGDLLRGPSGRFSDIVKTVDGSGFYIFNDGTNLLCRIRMGGLISGSKGYSVLIDTDKKFGATGPDADPNYQPATTGTNGNPGFELEVVMETNFRVAIYNVDGTSNPVLMTSFPIATNSQISVARTTDGGDADFFYDFYVPFTAMGITSSTPIRLTATTVMSPQAAIGGPKSDIYGTSGNNYMSDWEDIIGHQPPFPSDSVAAGAGGISPMCTKAPVVNGPLAPTATTVTGIWTKSSYSNISTALITLYKGATVIGSTTITSGNTWSISVIGLANNDVVTAKAKALGESQCQTSNQVIVNGCTSTTHTAAPVITCSSIRGFEGTMASGASVTLYKLTSAGYTTYADDATTTYKITYPTATTWRYDDVNTQSGSACSGGASDVPAGAYAAVATLAPNCSSLPANVCLSGTAAPATPTITSSLLDGAATITGTAPANSGVNLFLDGYFVQSTIASSTGAYTFMLIKKLQFNQQVEINSATAGSCVSASITATVTCFIAAPVINTNAASQVPVGSSLTGLAQVPTGTTISIYNSSTNALVGSTTTLANGTWTLATPTVVAATSYYAKTTGTVCGNSLASNLVSAATPTAPSRCGTINSPVLETATSVSGTVSTAVAGTSVTLYVDGVDEGSTTISGTTWTIPVNTTNLNTIYSASVLTIGISETAKTEAACIASVTVACNPPATPAVTPTNSMINTGDTVKYTISNSMNGILYSLRDSADAVNTGSSKFGTGSSITLSTNSFNTPGAYKLLVKATSFSGANCTSASLVNVNVFGALPVELTEFSGVYSNAMGKLKWVTSSQLNIDHFEVEKNTGAGFSKIGSLQAHGSSLSVNQYAFVDSFLTTPLAYYRLRVVEKNRTDVHFSQVLLLRADKIFTITKVTPNPFTENLWVTVNLVKETDIVLTLRDISGKKLKTQTIKGFAGNNSFVFGGLKDLPSGTYVMEVQPYLQMPVRQLISKQ